MMLCVLSHLAELKLSSLLQFDLLTICLFSPCTHWHMYTHLEPWFQHSLYDKVWVTLHSSHFIRRWFGPAVLWGAWLLFPSIPLWAFTLMVCLQSLSLPIPDITQGELSLILHNSLCCFLSNTNLFCLYSVTRALHSANEHISGSSRNYTLCHL